MPNIVRDPGKLVFGGLSTRFAEMWNECEGIYKFLSLCLSYTILDTHVIKLFEQTFWEIHEFICELSRGEVQIVKAD